MGIFRFLYRNIYYYFVVYLGEGMIILLIELFTDGSSVTNDKVKASAAAYAIYIQDRLIKNGTEFYQNGTNNLAESSAILIGLDRINKLIRKVDKKYINLPVTIHVYSDSLITVESCRNWIYKWVKKYRNGILLNAHGQEVANQDIFKKIYNKYLTNDMYSIKFFHINSHKIDHHLYLKYFDYISEYFQNRHKKKKLKLDIPNELFTNDKFRKAKNKFENVNKISIEDEELLRLLIYNKYVDKLAGECLDEGLSELAV